MKIVVALILGCMSGFLLYMAAAMMTVNVDTAAGPSPVLVLVTFVGGWIATTYFLLRGAKSVSRVFTRGSLVGAAEWLLLGLAGIVLSGKAVSNTIGAAGTQDGAEAAGAAIGGGLMATIAGGVSVAMAVVCLIVFAIAHFAGREMADTTSTPTKRCPDCAEMVQVEARKCKHCGATLLPAAAA